DDNGDQRLARYVGYRLLEIWRDLFAGAVGGNGRCDCNGHGGKRGADDSMHLHGSSPFAFWALLPAMIRRRHQTGRREAAGMFGPAAYLGSRAAERDWPILANGCAPAHQSRIDRGLA